MTQDRVMGCGAWDRDRDGVCSVETSGMGDAWGQGHRGEDTQGQGPYGDKDAGRGVARDLGRRCKAQPGCPGMHTTMLG